VEGTGGRVERVILCSGKVYYDLAEQRAKETKSVAIVRVEQIYPFPAEQIERTLSKYARGHALVIWAQEESQNMGGWSFIEPRIRSLGFDVKYVGRDASASPATGSLEIHKREQRELVRAAFHAEGAYLVSSQGMFTPPHADGKKSAAENGAVAEESAAKTKR
jgi:2-oxoglutarate dehydrogenase E1 component